MELYFIVFKNDILRNKIYNYVKEYNSKLYYKCYNYYEFPIELIIKTRNYQMLIERINIINGNTNNQELKQQNYINKETIKLLLGWNEISLDLFKVIQNIYYHQINEIINKQSITFILSSDCNIQKFKYLLNQQHTKNQFHHHQEEEESINIITENTIQLLDYILNELKVIIPFSVSLNIINQIIIGQRESKLYLKSFFELIYNDHRENYEKLIFESINLSCQINDEYSFKLMVSLYNDLVGLYSIPNTSSLYSLYGLDNIQSILFSRVTKYSLFKSNNLQLFKIMYNYRSDIFKISNTDNGQSYDITENEIALFLISNVSRNEISNEIYRFNYSCFKNENLSISDVSPYKKLNVFIRDNLTNNLSIYKLNIFQQIRVMLTAVDNIDGFNGNLELFKMFHSFYKTISPDYLNVFKYSIIFGYKELVDHMLRQDLPKSKVFIPLFDFNYYQLKQIFNIHGNDCNPFETANSKIENGISYYFIKIKQQYQDLSTLNLNVLPKDPLKRKLFLNNIYENQSLINYNKQKIEIENNINNTTIDNEVNEFDFGFNFFN